MAKARRNWLRNLQVAIQHLGDLSAQILRANDESMISEIANLSGFIGGLERVGELLEPESGLRVRSLRRQSEPKMTLSRVRFRSCGFPLQRQARRGDHFSPAGRIDHATRRSANNSLERGSRGIAQHVRCGGPEDVLRLAGCVTGGLAALAAMLIVSRNFDSLAGVPRGDICRDDLFHLRGPER